jgi:hypothetical protein
MAYDSKEEFRLGACGRESHMLAELTVARHAMRLAYAPYRPGVQQRHGDRSCSSSLRSGAAAASMEPEGI